MTNMASWMKKMNGNTGEPRRRDKPGTKNLKKNLTLIFHSQLQDMPGRSTTKGTNDPVKACSFSARHPILLSLISRSKESLARLFFACSMWVFF